MRCSRDPLWAGQLVSWAACVKSAGCPVRRPGLVTCRVLASARIWHGASVPSCSQGGRATTQGFALSCWLTSVDMSWAIPVHGALFSVFTVLENRRPVCLGTSHHHHAHRPCPYPHPRPRPWQPLIFGPSDLPAPHTS